MRRVTILVLLYVGMQLIIPLGEHERAASQTLLIFGFLMLTAYTFGELAKLVTLPKITGYLAAGLLFGPGILDIVGRPMVLELAPVERLAIALIAFLAGAELRVDELKERGRAILSMLGLELVLAFVFISAALIALRPWIPFLQLGGLLEAVLLSFLFASIAVVHSPAVTMALLTETRARGPVARTTLGIVLVADVVVVLLFSAMLAVTRTVVIPAGETAPAGISAAALAWELGGAVLVGALLGGAVALYLRFVQRELFLFAILVAFLGAEIARVAHVETLLTLLVAGFVTENASGKAGAALLHAMERSAAPVFVVFFALAGAAVHLDELAALWPVALAIVAARAFGIWSGSWLGARWSGAGDPERRYVWLGLISQAGVAIGLSSILAEAYPARGEAMRTLLLAVITINEIGGQIVFKLALVRSGEAEPDAPPVALQPDDASEVGIRG